MKNEKNEKKIIDMEQRNGVFVPAKIMRVRESPEKIFRRKALQRPQQPQQIGKILEGIITDLFREIRRGMF